jgi:exopolyphosphatase/guanosine-5'-triphosphate,3'-diphosphate pyrophosphatase
LILNSELAGFERRQLQLLASVARYHRGSPPKRTHAEFAALLPEDRRRVSALAAILRLALALDRTHQQNVANVRARVTPRRVRITIDSHGDANVDLWAAERKVELFQKVFGREVVFSARDTSTEIQPGVRQRGKREVHTASKGAEAANGTDAPNGKRRRKNRAEK